MGAVAWETAAIADGKPINIALGAAAIGLSFINIHVASQEISMIDMELAEITSSSTEDLE